MASQNETYRLLTRSDLQENFEALQFALSPADVEKLDGFDEGFITGWDPTQDP